MRHTLAPSRTRRIAKWTGLVVCVVILAMWAVSTRYGVMKYGQRVDFFIGASGLTIQTGSSPGQGEWEIGRLIRFFAGLKLPRIGSFGGVAFIAMPFWLLLALAAIPTALLWHRDRCTVEPGCCLVCGYDLRASKKTCPECGTPIAKPR